MPPTMSVGMMTEAVGISIECILEHLEEQNSERQLHANGEC